MNKTNNNPSAIYNMEICSSFVIPPIDRNAVLSDYYRAHSLAVAVLMQIHWAYLISLYCAKWLKVWLIWDRSLIHNFNQFDHILKVINKENLSIALLCTGKVLNVKDDELCKIKKNWYKKYVSSTLVYILLFLFERKHILRICVSPFLQAMLFTQGCF